MNQKLLDLTPKRYLCPFCGEWHNWEIPYKLGDYDLSSYKARLECKNGDTGYSYRDMQVCFSDGYCYYKTTPTCGRGNLDINDKIPIEDIVESSEKPRVTFDVPFTAKKNVGRSECSDCAGKYICLMRKLGDENNSRHMYITFGFEFKQSDYEKFSNAALLARKEKELQEREQAISSGEQALKEEREDAVVSKEQVSQQPQVKENKEETTMANNIFNMNMEFGPNKDENIASTLMGVAVKDGDSWRIYDKKKKEITDVGDMQLGNLPIFILPTTKLREGDLIKDDGEYYFVTKVATSKTPTQTLSARTGEMKSIVPIKNVLGFSCYSKVIAFSDSLNMDDDFDVEKLAVMSAMCGQNGGQMNQLLPLMLFKDKLDGDDDTMKLVLMSSMMTSEDDSGQMNQLLPLMLFKDKLDGDDDTMKLVLMSSMMGGNMASSNNPLMGYLMLDTFMGKKNGKALQTGDSAAK
ncbi:MAG: hypothetical protein HFJ35_02230 [Clostridia bacterium]|nr:hypothetical protein [Clostridia bacterium]